jgi:O-antigen/teichoic acid export membrane protein
LRNLAGRARVLASGDFVRHGVLVFCATMLINVLGYGFHFAISRKVGVEQYGVLSALNALFMISLVIGGIVNTVVVKYAAEFRALDDRAHLAILARKLSLYGSAAALVVAVAGIAAAAPLAAYLKIDNMTAVVLTMIVIGFSVAIPGLRGVFQGTEEFTSYSISIVLESTLKAAFGIGLVYAGFGVSGAFAGWAAGSCIAFIYTMTILLRRFRTVADAPLHVDFRRLVQTMANVAVATLLLTAMSYADVIVVKHFADPTTAGLYGALSLSGKILLFLVGFVPTVLLPKATRQAMGGVSPVRVFLQALGLSVLMSSAGLVVYYFFPALVVTTLAGDSFAPAAPYVFGYGFAMVLLAGLSVVVAYKIGIHRFDFLAPLALCAIGEIAGITLRHRSLGDVIWVLVIGNGCALVAAAYRVTAPLATRLAIVAPEAASPDAA